jgi:type IV pilus assembly protein PilE
MAAGQVGRAGPRPPTRPARLRVATGFTLVELLVAIAIAGIVLAVAVPGYGEYVRRAARSDAQLVLQQAANHLERVYSECHSYTRRNAATVPPCGTAVAGLPDVLTRSPAGGTARYEIVLAVHEAQAYELRARPLWSGGDSCGEFILRSTGIRDVTGPSPKEQCWGR